MIEIISVTLSHNFLSQQLQPTKKLIQSCVTKSLDTNKTTPLYE